MGIHSQEELARLLQLEGVSVTRASISHWEIGRYSPPLRDEQFRRALARVLRITDTQLLELAGYVTSTEHSMAGERAASIVDRLPKDKQDLAIRVLEQFEI